MWFLQFCLVLVFNVQWISCRCHFDSFNAEYPPIFTQKFGDAEVVLKPVPPRHIDIAEGSSVIAYCDDTFSSSSLKRSSSDYNSDPLDVTAVQIKCSENQLNVTSLDETEKYFIKDQLTCYGNQPALYPGYQTSCPNDGKSLQYGLRIAHREVLLATLCYNYKMEEISYIHYKSVMANVLDNMDRGMAAMEPSRRMNLNFVESNRNRSYAINHYFRTYSNVLTDRDQFQFDYLVPIDLLTKNFSHQTDIIEPAISIPWWNNLKEGNWKLFMEHLRNEIIVRDFDIYTGAASFDDMHHIVRLENEDIARKADAERARAHHEFGIIIKNNSVPYRSPNAEPTYPWIGNNNRYRATRSITIGTINRAVKYMSGSVVRDVPFFIWTYIKGGTDDDSSVVFAVNSPFVEAQDFDYINLCRQTPTALPFWLQSLKHTAKMPSLGYMFTCPIRIIKRYLQMAGEFEEPK